MSSKAFLLADIHLGCHQVELDKWLEVSRSYFFDFFFPILSRQYKQGDRLYILGDVFDNRSYLDIKVISYALDIFDELERMGIETHMILGNHDMRSEKSYEYHSLKLFSRYSNVTVYTEPTLVDHGSKRILMMPWITEKKEELAVLRKFTNAANYLFCHSDLSGAKTNMKTVLNHGLTIADFVQFPKVYSGHIHIRQRIHNFLFVGSPYQMDRNDKGNRKGVFILDVETGAEDFIANDHSPEFKTVEIKEEEDIDKLELLVPNGDVKQDWYDLVISSSLLIKSKKLAASLRDITKKTKILTVKHIDDLVIGDKEDDVQLEQIGSELSIDDFIRDYIMNQCSEADTDIKDKVMDELQDCVRIFYTDK